MNGLDILLISVISWLIWKCSEYKKLANNWKNSALEVNKILNEVKRS